MLLFADPCGQFYSTTAQAASGLWQSLSATIKTSGLPAGNVGSTALQIGNLSGAITVPQTPGTYYIGFRVCFTSTLSQQSICQFRDPFGSVQVQFNVEANGTIQANRGSSTVLGTSSTSTVLLQNVWAYVELSCSVDASNGTIGVRINGNNVLTLTGQNTKGSGSSSNIGSLVIGCNLTNFFQDLYITDGTGTHNTGFLGDVHISTYNPISNGTHADYTPNGAATLYQSVNAVTPTDSTVFASDSTPGDKMSVNLASTSVSGTIAGVINIGRMKKTDSGTRTANLFALNGGTEVDGSSIALGTSYAYYQQVLEVDPNTNAPWTNSGFNTAQLGCETLT